MNKIRSFEKFSLSLTVLFLSFLSLTGCSGPGSSDGTAKIYTNPTQCNNQNFPVGLPGNIDCPYLGEYDPNRGYQPYAIIHKSIGIGVGFYIDFGWHYKDMCPKVGQLPVFQNGSFDYCSSVNPTFAQTDFLGFTQPNTGECTGEQYNPEITGCLPSLEPTELYY